MVYIDITLSTVLILAGVALIGTVDGKSKTTRGIVREGCMFCVSFAAILIGVVEFGQTIEQDQSDRKDNKTLSEYCHPYRPERIIIQKSRKSAAVPYRVKVTVLPDRSCSKVRRKSRVRNKGLVKV